MTPQNPKTWIGRLWRRFTSPTILAFVAVAVAAGMIFKNTDDEIPQQANPEETRKLIAEIENRASQMQKHIMGITDRDGITRLLKGIDPVTGENLPMGLYSEYDEESLYTLLSQLEQNLEQLPELSEQEQRILRKAKISTKYIRDVSTDKSYAYTLYGSMQEYILFSGVDTRHGKHIDELLEELWSKLDNLLSIE